MKWNEIQDRTKTHRKKYRTHKQHLLKQVVSAGAEAVHMWTRKRTLVPVSKLSCKGSLSHTNSDCKGKGWGLSETRGLRPTTAPTFLLPMRRRRLRPMREPTLPGTHMAVKYTQQYTFALL